MVRKCCGISRIESDQRTGAGWRRARSRGSSAAELYWTADQRGYDWRHRFELITRIPANVWLGLGLPASKR